LSGELAERKVRLLTLLASSRYPPSGKALSVYSNGCDSEKNVPARFRVPFLCPVGRPKPQAYTLSVYGRIRTCENEFAPSGVKSCRGFFRVRLFGIRFGNPLRTAVIHPPLPYDHILPLMRPFCTEKKLRTRKSSQLFKLFILNFVLFEPKVSFLSAQRSCRGILP